MGERGLSVAAIWAEGIGLKLRRVAEVIGILLYLDLTSDPEGKISFLWFVFWKWSAEDSRSWLTDLSPSPAPAPGHGGQNSQGVWT